MPHPRDPYDQEGGLIYFPRMLDKIRLHLKGELPEDFHRMRGNGFDGLCCKFLQVDYDDVYKQVESGKTDAEVLAWCFENGRKPTEHDIEMYNNFMAKRGWRDSASKRLAEIVADADLSNIDTFFDLIQVDEGRI